MDVVAGDHPAAGELDLPGNAEAVAVDPGGRLEGDPAHLPLLLASLPPRRLPLAGVGDVERDRPRDAADGQLDVAPKAVPAVRSVKRQLKVILGWFSTSKKSALRRWASRSHFHAAGRKVPSQGRKAEAVLKQGLGTLGITALLALIPATDASAVSSSRQVEIRDDCEPATFNAVVGPGTCVKDGGTTFSEFVD